MMDQTKIKQSAEQLDELLSKYGAVDDLVRGLQETLRSRIQDALHGRITAPLDRQDIPGGLLFTETHLGDYRELEYAYSRFKIQVTGDGDNPALKYLAELRDKRK